MSSNIEESDNAYSFDGEMPNAQISQDTDMADSDAAVFAAPAVPDGFAVSAKPGISPEASLKLFFKTTLHMKLAENKVLEAANAKLEKTYKELLNQKYAYLCQMNMPSNVNASSVLPIVNNLKEREQQMLDRMHKVIHSEKEMSAAYAIHCEEVIKVQKTLPQAAKYDEYTMMPYNELLTCKNELDSKVEETRAKCQSMTAELKAMEKEYESQYNSIMQEAETFQQYEMEALQALELVKFEVEKRKLNINNQ